MSDVTAPPDLQAPAGRASSGRQSFNLAALAVAFAGGALLADAAVETYAAGAPVRWWVVGAAVAYAGVTAATFRMRFGWRTQFTVALVGVLGLVAITAWRPDGLSDGIRLVGQPTPRVLCILTAAALVAALVLMLRATVLPFVARLILALTAIYGAAAFAVGAWQTTAYTALFAGNGLWSAAPQWLQGPMIGSLIALPAALIVSLVGGLRHGKHGWRSLQMAGIALTLVVVTSAITKSWLRSGGTAVGLTESSPVARSAPGQTSHAASAATPPGTAGSPGSADSDHPLTDLKNAETNLKASIDYSRIDVSARLAKIGADPRAIAAFVQNEIRYEVYSGALRGPRGTLLARAGNAIDRALLLSAMLRTAGFTTRFAQATLSPNQAAQIVRTAFHSSPATSQLDPRLQEVVDRAKSHFIYLGNALYDAGFTSPQGDAGAWDRTIREAQQHCWVQLQGPDGWIDVDPSPGTPYGQSVTSQTGYSDELNPTLYEAIDIRVQVESIHNATRVTKTVLQHTERAIDLAGVSIGIFHERKGATATPVLVIGDKIIKGQLFESTATIGVDGIGNVAVVNPFDTVSGNGADRLGAVWIQFHATGPSGDRQASYTVVDTEGAAARQSGAPPKSLSGPDVTAVLNALDSFVGLSVATGDVPVELPVSLMADGLDPQSDTAPVRVLSMFAFTDCYFRGLLRPSFLNASSLWYIDSPNVIIARLQPGTSESPAILSLDLSLKSYRSLRTPDDPLLKRGPFYDYLAAGVIDHMLERWLLGAGADSGSVGALFETTAPRQVKALVPKPGSNQIQGLPLTTDGQIRLSGTLATDRLVVVPAAIPGGWKSAAGWWSIDPATGWTEDVTEGGYHASDLAERSLLQRLIAHPGFRAFCAVAAVVSAAAGIAASITKASWVPVAAGVGGAWAAVCAVLNNAAPPPGPPSLPPPPAGGLPTGVFSPSSPAPWWPSA